MWPQCSAHKVSYHNPEITQISGSVLERGARGGVKKSFSRTDPFSGTEPNILLENTLFYPVHVPFVKNMSELKIDSLNQL